MISIVMTNYNRAAYVGESIRSVLDQTYGDFELIVVDDGSTDASCEVIRSMGDPRIRLFECPVNRHISAATNFGIAQMSPEAEYLAFADSDDIWYPEKLARQMAFFENNPSAQIVFTKIDLIDEKGNDINEEKSSYLAMFDNPCKTRAEWLRYFFFVGNRLSNPSVLMKRGLAERLGDHAVGLAQLQDMETWVRAAKLTDLFVMDERLIAMRRFSADSGENATSQGAENVRRHHNEMAYIRTRFFEGMDDELFVEAFRPYFRNPDSRTPQELACEKAFLLLYGAAPGWAFAPAGVWALQKLLADPASERLLRERFDFRPADLHEMTGSLVYPDPLLENEVESLHRQVEDGERLLEVARRRGEEGAAAAEAEKQALRGELDALQGELEASRGEVRDLHASTSWKVTAPLRALSRAGQLLSSAFRGKAERTGAADALPDEAAPAGV